MLEEAKCKLILAFCSLGCAPDEHPSSTQPNHGSVPVLIKKKDVNDYFAARRGRHPLSVKRAVLVAAPSKNKRDTKASTAVLVDVPGSSAPAQDLHVPFFTSEPGFIEAAMPVVNRWTKA